MTELGIVERLQNAQNVDAHNIIHGSFLMIHLGYVTEKVVIMHYNVLFFFFIALGIGSCSPLLIPVSSSVKYHIVSKVQSYKVVNRGL